MIEHPPLKLKELMLCHNPIGPSGVKLLVKAPLEHLEKLWLSKYLFS